MRSLKALKYFYPQSLVRVTTGTAISISHRANFLKILKNEKGSNVSPEKSTRRALYVFTFLRGGAYSRCKFFKPKGVEQQRHPVKVAGRKMHRKVRAIPLALAPFVRPRFRDGAAPQELIFRVNIKLHISIRFTQMPLPSPLLLHL